MAFRFPRGPENRIPLLDNGRAVWENIKGRLIIGGPSGNIEIANKSDVDAVSTQLAEIPNQTYIIDKAKTTDVNNALASKADKTTTDNLQSQVTSLASGAPIAVTLAANMTDHTRNYVYTGAESGYTAGHWYFWNGSVWTDGGVYQATGIAKNSIDAMTIKNGSLIPEKSTFVTVGANKFDVSRSVIGKYQNYVGGVYSLSTNASYDTSDYIPVKAGQQYAIAPLSRVVVLFDLNYNVLNYDDVANWATRLVTPTQDGYMRITYSTGTANMVVNEGNTATYTQYEIKMPKLVLDDLSPILGSVLYGTLAIDTTTYKATLSAAVVNTSIVYTEKEAFTNVANQTVDWSAEANPSYARYICLLRSTKELKVYTPGTFSKLSVIVIGIVYNGKIYLSPSMANITVNGVKNGGWGEVPPSTWNGKKWVSYGDSITNNGGWQALVSPKLGLSHTNMGVSGSTIIDYSTWAVPMCNDSRLNSIPIDTNVITIMGGTNDWDHGSPIGTIADTGKDTFLGAYKYIIDTILNRIPTCRIILLCPPFGFYKADQQPFNSIGLTTQDYGNAVKQIGDLYNLPVIDVCNEAGINIKNALSFMSDQDTTVHMLDSGNKRLAGLVKGSLDKYEPF